MNQLREYFNKLYILKDKDWKVFGNLFTEIILKKGEYFAKEGNIERNLGFIADGVARAFFRSKDGFEYNKKFFVNNEIIAAYSSLISKNKAKVSVQALTDCRILVADYYAIEALFDNHPMIERLIRVFDERLYLIKEKREIEMALLHADERYRIFKEEYPTLENIIPQYYIASYLGITPIQLSRIRAKK